jgi:hypothetical protein
VQKTVSGDAILGQKTLMLKLGPECFLIPAQADQQVKFLAGGFNPQNGQELPVRIVAKTRRNPGAVHHECRPIGAAGVAQFAGQIIRIAR